MTSAGSALTRLKLFILMASVNDLLDDQLRHTVLLLTIFALTLQRPS